MASIFKNKTIKEKLEKFDIPEFEEKLASVKRWQKAYKDRNLQKNTETQCEQAFNQDYERNI